MPEGTFSRRHGGPWKTSPANITSVLKQMRDPKGLERVGKEHSLRFVGAETLDHLPVHIYETSYSSPELKSTGRYWVGVSDHLVRKIEVIGETKRQVFYGRPVGGISKTVKVYSDYNSGITIVAPKL